MFSLPQGGLVSEGRTEDRPIVLSGDTPDEFRHFLWALYALFVHLHRLFHLLNQLIENNS